MTLENELALSYYKEITQLANNKEVYLVKHQETGIIYVKKYLSAYNKDIIMHLMQNPIEGIPGIIEYIEDDEQLIVIEEYIAGRTLQQIYDERGFFSDEKASLIMIQILEILNRLHQFNPPIIHRDIKPDNLIITNDGILKLVDFGAAKKPMDGATRDTMLIGTEHFAAPEQYGFGQSNIQTDIYGVGATINYLMTGKYPNEGIAEGKLQDVLGKCLKMEPKDRYESCTKVIEDLNSLKSNQYYNKYLPVGFRALNISHMIIASAYYIFAIIFVSPWDGESTIFESFLWLCDLIFAAFWFGNYLEIRNKITGAPAKSARNIAISICIWLLFTFSLTLIMPE